MKDEIALERDELIRKRVESLRNIFEADVNLCRSEIKYATSIIDCLFHDEDDMASEIIELNLTKRKIEAIEKKLEAKRAEIYSDAESVFKRRKEIEEELEQLSGESRALFFLIENKRNKVPEFKLNLVLLIFFPINSILYLHSKLKIWLIEKKYWKK